MRLSKTAWLILGAGIFVIAFAVLFMFYSQQAGDEEQMAESLDEAEALLPQLVAEREDWESQLSQLESQLAQEASALDKSIAKFPEEVESIEYDEELFMIAHDYGLEISSLTASEPREQEVEDIIYSVTYFDIEVCPDGALPDPLTEAYLDAAVANMLKFIDTVVNGEYFTTATVERITLQIPEISEAEKPLGIIKLIIYSYTAPEVYEQEVDEGE